MDEVELKRQRKAARKAAKESISTPVEEEASIMVVDEAELKRQRKAAKKAAKDACTNAVEGDTALSMEVNAQEDKQQRKAAKKAAKEARSAEIDVTTAGDDDEEQAKRQRKAAKKAAKEAVADIDMPAAADDEDEAKRKRKAAKKAAKEAMAGTNSAQDQNDELTNEEEEAQARRERKAAKKAAKEAAAVAAEEQQQQPQTPATSSTKRASEDAQIDEEEAPKAKKSKPMVNLDADTEKKHKGPDAKEIGSVDDFSAFVRGLPWSITEEMLHKDFSECGEIRNIKMPKTEDGKPRGFAFVKFTTQDGCDSALKFDSTEYGGRTIFVCKAGENTKGRGKDGKGQSKSANSGRNNPLTLCIKGLPYSIDEEVLRKDFSECGEIAKMSLHNNAEGQSTGMAFLTFKAQEGFDAALKFNDTEYAGRWLEVAKPRMPGEGSKGAGKDAGKSNKGKNNGKDSKGKKGNDSKGKGKGKSNCDDSNALESDA